MISIIDDVPGHVIAFRATGTVSADDFKDILLPAVEKHLEVFSDLNYMLVIDTDLSNFTIGSWIQNVSLGLQQLKNWRKAAIICDVKFVKVVTDTIFKVMPGEFKVYEHERYDEALVWVSN
ncbi:STAS/SEC14 domain-containing protein [Niabella sp. 22666]|uniref:STAS/SEC14 domain-containing protein n=1 Tax=Niabella sp. 22666 TaxID=3453954 RepID=UPI003F8749F0